MPIIKSGELSGQCTAERIAGECEKLGMNGSQISSMSFDGQYFNEKVPEKLAEILGTPDSVYCNWDNMHR